MVGGAAWSPSYDLRASTEGGKPPKTVTLHYRAAIIHNSGEDWTNINLSLSTASPGLFTQIPILRSLRIVPGHSPGFRQHNNVLPGVFPQMHKLQQSQVSLFGQQQMPARPSGAFSVFGGSRPLDVPANPHQGTTSPFGASSSNLPGVTSTAAGM